MRVGTKAILGLLAATIGTAAAPPPIPASDEAAIRILEKHQETSWNAHDIDAYAGLFAPDADVVNVLGWWWKGRQELRQKLGRGFASVFARSELHIMDVNLRSVAPGIVAAHVSWTMTGALSPDGSGGNIPQRGIQTQLLMKNQGVWQITLFQNTNAVQERAFSNGPASPASPPR